MSKFHAHIFLVVGLAVLFIRCSSSDSAVVRTGLDVLMDERIDDLTGKHIGIITNHTGLDRNGNHIVDLLKDHPEFEVVALFGPEHGVRGNQNEWIPSERDQKPPVYSLYGETRKPTPEMLEGIDLLIFDIQDIGARFYTYISTMAYDIEAAAEYGIPFVVLDRPNPVTGRLVEGPVLDIRFKSFVGIAPIPVRHGMTVGELARMFNDEGWLEGGVRCDLEVIPMDGWRRELWYDQTDLGWIKPSPNMPDLEAAALYPGICFLEATNVSEGRGTEAPFKQIGAPWINGTELSEALNAQHIANVRFFPASFTPVDMPGMAMDPKYEGEECRGVRIEVTDRNRFEAVAMGIRLICTIRDLYPRDYKWRQENRRGMELLSGTGWIPSAIDEGETAVKIIHRWQAELERFKELRQRYLIYD